MERGYIEDNKTAFPHPLAWTKLKLGWLGSENVREAKLGRTESIEIVALESTASRGLPRAIRVPAGGTEFFIELRKQIGVSVLFEEGVLVYSVRDRTVRVLGADPKSFGLGDAPFGQGEVFRDRDHKLQVEILKVDEDMAEIRVTWLVELPKLEIRAVPGMCFSVDGENFTADSEGRAIEGSARIEDFDFSGIRRAIEAEQTKREGMTREERRGLAEERRRTRESNRERYGYALVDGKRVEKLRGRENPVNSEILLTISVVLTFSSQALEPRL